jgi:hypothetical protein
MAEKTIKGMHSRAIKVSLQSYENPKAVPRIKLKADCTENPIILKTIPFSLVVSEDNLVISAPGTF